MPLERLMHLISKLRPRAAHILLVERDDGHAFLKSTFNPRGTLQALNGAGILTHRWEAIDTPHAEEIALRVSSEFILQRVDAHGPWYVADYDDILRVVHDYDPHSGARVRDARFVIGMRVEVSGVGRGHVTHYRGPMLVVQLERPLSADCASVVAPKSLVKPVLRLITEGVA